MQSEIDKLSADARVWIYQAGKKLTEAEKKGVLEKAKYFVNNWSTHGNPLKAEADILYDTFLVLSIDESDLVASGCSIDKSLQFIQQLEYDFKIDLLNRETVAVLENGEVRHVNLDVFKSLIKEGKINKDSIIFNNLVSSKRQMDTDWKIPVSKSWLKKYLPEN